MLQKIFGLFMQVDSSNTRSQGGWGAGRLWSVRSSSCMTGGRSPSPGVGLGSVFTIRFAAGGGSGGVGGCPGAPRNLLVRRILVVDDNAVGRVSAGASSRQAGAWEVRTAGLLGRGRATRGRSISLCRRS